MTLLDYGLPLASFAGAGLAWYFAGRTKSDSKVAEVAMLTCLATEDRVVNRGSRYVGDSCRYAAAASRAAGLCHDAATQVPANTDAVDDATVRLLDDSDVFGDGYFKRPDDTAELAVMPPEVC